MSAAIGIASTSAVLTAILREALDRLSLYQLGASVTGGALDLKDPDEPRLNLFLLRATPNAGYANIPSRPPLRTPAPPEQTRSEFGPLVLDLHYLITAHAKKAFEAELMLGEAMLTLHERQHLGRERIESLLAQTDPPSPLTGEDARRSRAALALARQVEAITITLVPQRLDEYSQLWSAMQSPARPSACYLVTAIMLERLDEPPLARIVLSRGARDDDGHETGPRVEPMAAPDQARVVGIEAPSGEPAAQIGETVRVRGTGLASGGTRRARFLPRDGGDALEIDLVSVDDTVAELTLRRDANWHPGSYDVEVSDAVAPAPLTVSIAPEVHWKSSVVQRSGSNVDIRVGFSPAALPGQRLVLTLGGESVGATAVSGDGKSADFTFAGRVKGRYPAFLSVDGVASRLFDRTQRLPVVPDDRYVTVP